MRTTPEDLIEHVQDELSFIQFVSSLAEDWETEAEMEREKPSPPYGPGALGWYNGTIGAFLEAASACGTDHLERGGMMPGANPWRIAAEILLAGKYYE